MSDIAIRLENLSKLYIIGAAQKRHDTLRDQISGWARGALRSNHKSEIGNHKWDDTIWALRDVSFEVKRGEVVGIVGRNGAGKSTLLKILSRITEPTRGRAVINGRVGSLLEVGTGFHPELTGRENIYLNGSILGMKRAEIGRRFDEIVAFAEVGKFLDTPVKRYSSGMYVRLAFAVAAHLEPEILLVDEVLAVGDIAFQKKCLGKMGNVARQGRTVLFVSHNMTSIADLCSRAVLLADGCVEDIAEVPSIIRRYLSIPSASPDCNFAPQRTRNFRIESIRCYGPGQEGILPLQELNIAIQVVPSFETRDVSIHILIIDQQGRICLGFDSVDFGAVAESGIGMPVWFNLRLPSHPLPPGSYHIDAYLKSRSSQVSDHVEGLVSFQVSDTPVYGNRLYERQWHGQCIAAASMKVSTVGA